MPPGPRPATTVVPQSELVPRVVGPPTYIHSPRPPPPPTPLKEMVIPGTRKRHRRGAAAAAAARPVLRLALLAAAAALLAAPAGAAYNVAVEFGQEMCFVVRCPGKGSSVIR